MVKKIITSCLHCLKKLFFYNPLGKIDQINLSIQQQNLILHKYNKKDMNLLERSYAQYRCQMELLKVHQRIILHLIGYMYICIVPFLFVKQKPKKLREVDAIIMCEQDILPNILKNNSASKIIYKKILLFKDFPLLIKIFLQYPLDSYFLSKIIYKISLYRYNNLVYNNKKFIVTSEYSFTSSIGTLFCGLNNIEHINVMHGEKYFFIGDSYFQFHKCYVWEKHYKDLFVKLLAEKNQFIIALPSIFERLKMEKIEKDKQKILTYYLQNETLKELKMIYDACLKCSDQFIVFIRPHPVYSNIREINRLFPSEMIQKNETDIYDSLLKTTFVVSKFSTVLYMANMLKKDIILDDISVNIKFYENLKKLDYLIMKKKYTYLSNFLQSINNE